MRSGVAGISVWRIPSGKSASLTAGERVLTAVAQTRADQLSPADLHHILDRGACPRAGQRPDPWAHQCCPVRDVFAQSYHWSFMQIEFGTDLVFRSPAILQPLYEQLSRAAIAAGRRLSEHTVIPAAA